MKQVLWLCEAGKRDGRHLWILSSFKCVYTVLLLKSSNISRYGWKW